MCECNVCLCLSCNCHQHIDKVVRHKDLQQQLVDAKLHQAQELLKESEDRHDREKDFVMHTHAHPHTHVQIDTNLNSRIVICTEMSH